MKETIPGINPLETEKDTLDRRVEYFEDLLKVIDLTEKERKLIEEIIEKIEGAIFELIFLISKDQYEMLYRLLQRHNKMMPDWIQSK